MSTAIATIIVAVLSVVGTITGAYLANRKSSALIAYRLEQLEDKVALHNSAMERIYTIEQKGAVMEQKVKVADHRIANLEERLHESGGE